MMTHKKQKIFLFLSVHLVFLFSILRQGYAIPPSPEYLSLVQERIGANLFYPWEAKFNGWEGVVIVKFTLLRDGHLKELDIVKSSGYPLLDEAAVSAVREASPYPSLEYYHKAEELEVVLPITYQGFREAVPLKERPAMPSLEPIQEKEIVLVKETDLTEKEIAPPPTETKVSFAQPEEAAVPPEEIIRPSASEEAQVQVEEIPLPLEEAVLPTAEQLPPKDELEQFIDLAVKNNQPTQIARQEIELAQMKVKEAKRNLFPGLKVEGYDSMGEERTVEFEEREVKFQLDQPVYYGGRLRDTLKQSKVNTEITLRNYDRLKIDVSHKAEVAYYNLVASRMNLKIQEEIRHEAKKILDIVQKQFDAELATPLEIASAQSWHDQISFQINSTKQDMAMAELTFAQVLNVPEAPQVTREELEIKELDLEMNQCLEAGLKNRPEIYVSGLLVEFNQFGKKIEEAKNRFTIDLTTSYGYYQGAYKTEPMRSTDTWYVGFKASKPWGGSTFNASTTREDAGPRYGEKTRTEDLTFSADFNLLDNLSRLSDEKKSEIELQRALSDLNETTKTITFEIKDAYLNYQKALLQATTAQSEAEFRHREVEVLRVRAQVGDTGFSNVMETLVNLSRAQTDYTQALANYFISLANLRKAAGYGIKI